MLTSKDIENLTKYQLEVFKDVFVTKEDFDPKITKLQTSIDNMAKDIKDLKEDKVIVNHRMKNAENWIDKASPKLGLDFKH